MGYQLYVRTLTGKVLLLTVEGSTTVREVKTMIQSTEGIPEDQQRIIFSGLCFLAVFAFLLVDNQQYFQLGFQLEDEHSMSEYGVREFATLHLCLRLRGGDANPRHNAPRSTGFAVGGANDVTSFRSNVENGLVPKPSSITYEV